MSTVTAVSPPRRNFALIKLEAGRYLLPSNDGERMFMLTKYEETGNVGNYDAHMKWVPVLGTFWRTESVSMQAFRQWWERNNDLSGSFDLYDLPWDWDAGLLKTRQEAINAAMEAYL